MPAYSLTGQQVPVLYKVDKGVNVGARLLEGYIPEELTKMIQGMKSLPTRFEPLIAMTSNT